MSADFDFKVVSDEAVLAIAIKLSAEDKLVIASLLADRNVLANMMRRRAAQVARLEDDLRRSPSGRGNPDIPR